MPIVEKIKGNLVTLAQNGEFDIVAHGCNTRNSMGSGIAPQLAKIFPNALLSDKLFRTPYHLKMFEHDVQKTYHVGSSKRLGHFTYDTKDFEIGDSKRFCVLLNMYTQHYIGAKPDGSPPVEYDAIKRCFGKLNSMLKGFDEQPRIGIPLIGAGLARGDWNLIEKIINEVTPNLKITLVEYDNS